MREERRCGEKEGRGREKEGRGKHGKKEGEIFFDSKELSFRSKFYLNRFNGFCYCCLGTFVVLFCFCACFLHCYPDI